MITHHQRGTSPTPGDRTGKNCISLDMGISNASEAWFPRLTQIQSVWHTSGLTTRGCILICLTVLIAISWLAGHTVAERRNLKRPALSGPQVLPQLPSRQKVLNLTASDQTIIDLDEDLSLDVWKLYYEDIFGNVTGPHSLAQESDGINKECDFLWTVPAENYDYTQSDSMKRLLRAQQQWAESQPHRGSKGHRALCRALMVSDYVWPSYGEPFNQSATYQKKGYFNDHFRAKLHAVLAMHELAKRKLQVQPRFRYAGKHPFFNAITDGDVFMTNKSKNWETLLDQVAMGIDTFIHGGQTTESRLCDHWKEYLPDDVIASVPPFPCDRKEIEKARQYVRSLDDVTVILALDATPQAGWYWSSGIHVNQPASLTTKFIAQSALAMIHNPDIPSAYAKQGEQALISLTLEKTFNLNPAPSLWMHLRQQENPSVEELSGMGVELLAVRVFDPEAAQREPYFRAAVDHWLRDQDTGLPAPRAAVIVNNRWMNSHACNWCWADLREEGRWVIPPHRRLHCGDFIGHFNGCNKQQFGDPLFRMRLYDQCANSLDWPLLLNDDNTTFTWYKWLREGLYGFQHSGTDLAAK